MPSLKQIGTICFLFLILIFPTFADTLIPTPASCDNSVLNTTTGPASLEAIYSPNSINVKFYDGVIPPYATPDYNPYDPNNPGYYSGMCMYDMVLSLPPAPPIRPGYQFDGWTLYNPLRHIDLRAFPYSESNYYTAITPEQSVDNNVDVPQPVSWKLTNPLSQKTIYGQAKCAQIGSGPRGCKPGMTHCKNLPAYEAPNEFDWQLPLAGNVDYWKMSDEEMQEYEDYFVSYPDPYPQYYCWCKPVAYQNISNGIYYPVKITEDWLAPDYMTNSEDMCFSMCVDKCVHMYMYIGEEDIPPLEMYRSMMYHHLYEKLPQTRQELMEAESEYAQTHNGGI